MKSAVKFRKSAWVLIFICWQAWKETTHVFPWALYFEIQTAIVEIMQGKLQNVIEFMSM
jgi:hypothetical protein